MFYAYVVVIIAITTSSSIKVNRWFFIVPPLSIVALFLPVIYHLPNPMPSEVNLGVRSPKGRRSRLQLRFPIARDHALTHKFGLPFRIITVHKLVVTSYADGSGGPLALRTSPLASELPLTCKALPFAGGASAPYLSGYARQPFIVRYAHYARGASLSTFGFVTIVPRYLLLQVIPSHSFAALTALIVRRLNGLGDQSQLALPAAARPPEGHWRAHPAAALCRP